MTSAKRRRVPDVELTASTRAAILRAVAAERHPKHRLPAIAQRFGLQWPQLERLLVEAGYPDPAAVRRQLAILEAARPGAVP